MAVAFTELTSGETNADQNSYTTASVTLTAGRLYLLAAYTTKATPANPSAVATTGGAVTFNLKNASIGSPASYSTWYVVPSSTITDTILITATTANGCAWSLVEVQGSKTSGTTPGFDAFPAGQAVQATGSGVSNVTATLTNNIGAGNARYSLGQANASTTITVSSGTWSSGTNRNHTTPNATMRVAWDSAPAPTDKSATWTVSAGTPDMRSYILEIAAQAGEFVGSIPI